MGGGEGLGVPRRLAAMEEGVPEDVHEQHEHHLRDRATARPRCDFPATRAKKLGRARGASKSFTLLRSLFECPGVCGHSTGRGR